MKITTSKAKHGGNYIVLVTFPRRDGTHKTVSAGAVARHLGMLKSSVLTRLKKTDDPAMILAAALKEKYQTPAPNLRWQQDLDRIPAYKPPAGTSLSVQGWGGGRVPDVDRYLATYRRASLTTMQSSFQ